MANWFAGWTYGADLRLGILAFSGEPKTVADCILTTFISYFAVCVLRLVTTKQLIPFRREWGRGLVNTLLVGAMTVIITRSEFSFSHVYTAYAIAGGIFLLVLVVNHRPILEIVNDVKKMLRRR